MYTKWFEIYVLKITEKHVLPVVMPFFCFIFCWTFTPWQMSMHYFNWQNQDFRFFTFIHRIILEWEILVFGTDSVSNEFDILSRIHVVNRLVRTSIVWIVRNNIKRFNVNAKVIWIFGHRNIVNAICLLPNTECKHKNGYLSNLSCHEGGFRFRVNVQKLER